MTVAPDLAQRRGMVAYSDERVAFIGKTGSGKSYLARGMSSRFSRLVCLDPKGSLWRPEWKLDRWDDPGSDQIEQERFRLRVPMPDDGDWDPWLDRIFAVRNCCVYIDEAYGVTDGSQPSRGLRRIVTQGRELGIGVWAATQRPSWVPLILLSEADWYFVFQLRLEDDQRRMAGIIGPIAYTPLRDHNVVIYNDHMNLAIAKERIDLQPMTNGSREYRRGL